MASTQRDPQVVLFIGIDLRLVHSTALADLLLTTHQTLLEESEMGILQYLLCNTALTKGILPTLN